MFNVNSILTLLDARPFVPFRLILSDGGSVEVRSPEFVLPAKHLAVIGLIDPNSSGRIMDRWTTVWYMHVTRVEQTQPGAPPFASPAGPAESSTPSPA
jgi:hypothetical protein